MAAPNRRQPRTSEGMQKSTSLVHRTAIAVLNEFDNRFNPKNLGVRSLLLLCVMPKHLARYLYVSMI